MKNERFPALPWPDWKIVKQLGKGGYGKVYQVSRNTGGIIESAAIKVISFPKDKEEIEADFTDGYDIVSVRNKYADMLRKYAEEYQIMLAFKGQSNIVSCEDFTSRQHEDGIGWDVYIRMELLTPLTALVKEKNGQISEQEVIKAGKDICRALMLCESKNIVHRDIKPENIMLSEFGDYKLGDFGIAKTMDHATQATKIGSVRYMAPEVIKEEEYGRNVDIYSLGLVLYWMLNNRKRPFNDADCLPTDDEVQLAEKRRKKGDLLPPPKYGSTDLQKIVLKACAYRPEDRYQSAREMYEALDALQKGKTKVNPDPWPDLPYPGPAGPTSPEKPTEDHPESGPTGGGWQWFNAGDAGSIGDSGDGEVTLDPYHQPKKEEELPDPEGPAGDGLGLEGNYPDEKYLKTIRILLNICTVAMGICTFGIALIWCIPIRKKILTRIDRREPISSGLKIAALFVGTIPGLLLIVNEDI